MTLEQIHAAIPHLAPMLLVDDTVSMEEKTLVCKNSFRCEVYFFQGHYPDQPLVPGVILCECVVQSGAVLLADVMKQANSAGVPVLTRMSDVKFKNMVKPGDSIEMHVKLNDVVSTAYYLTGQAKVNGKTAARLSFTCTVANA